MARWTIPVAVVLLLLSRPAVPVTSSSDEGRPGLVNAYLGGPAVTFALRTNAFGSGEEIPAKYTCSGADVSPALSWSEPPANTQALALIVDDPDAPSGSFTHWVLYNLGPQEKELREGIPKTEQLPGGTLQGRNDFRRVGYGGPCPPPGKPHRYFFKLYALDTKLNLKRTRNRYEGTHRGASRTDGQIP
jgi:Raf kinase inhibitor-like YbhB/YbcL family protein